MATPLADRYDYVIVGGGPTGAGAVQSIRKHAPDASVALLEQGDVPPVYRPDLTKALWLDKNHQLDDSYLLDDDDPALHLGMRVTAIDTSAHTVTLADDRTVRYGALLIATGASARRAELPVGPRVLTYRSVADYQMLRAAAQPGSHIVVIGGGYIGAELASGLTQNEVQVTIVMPEQFVQEGMFPEEISRLVTDTFRDRGIRIRHGMLGSVTAREDSVEVRLDSGDIVTGDAVVAGLGVNPITEIAHVAGLDVDSDTHGIVVDEQLRTTAPDVYAAGDVAAYLDPLLGRRRVEHIDNAQSMGMTAGRVMTGDAVPFDYTPFFFSDLFDYGYEAVGRLNSDLRTVTDWNDDRSAAVAYYLDGGHVVGVLLWNTWDSVDRARDLIAKTKENPLERAEVVNGLIPPG